MKKPFKTMTKLAVAIAIATLPVVATAQLTSTYTTYNWVWTGGVQSSGQITIEEQAPISPTVKDQSSSILPSFTFAPTYTETSYNFDIDFSTGTIDDTVLSPNDPFDFSDNYMYIYGDNSDTSGNGVSGLWSFGGYYLSNTEIPLDQLNLDSYPSGGPSFTGGYWTDAAVPEPSTVMSGLLLLAPLGAGVLRFLRRGQ